ncbi:MAG: hypothetical protein H6661_07880 [Ardenticatenaceae bacterium]|nr:hypothetical protein [Ardenticatenaceae bacterium]
MGGGAAVHLAAGEARCRALLLLDPWLRPVDEAILQQGLDVPVLSLMSEGSLADSGRLMSS